MTTIDGALANLPEDAGAISRAISSMATVVENTVAQFPREKLEDDTTFIPVELLRTSSRIALVDAANKLEYCIVNLDRELRWARAKVLAWCAAEAEHKAAQE